MVTQTVLLTPITKRTQYKREDKRAGGGIRQPCLLLGQICGFSSQIVGSKHKVPSCQKTETRTSQGQKGDQSVVTCCDTQTL